jgi:dCTP deaminase
MILPAQDIRRLCEQGWLVPANSYKEIRHLISPFQERGTFDGRTYGLGPCSYDFRLDKILIEGEGMANEFNLEPGHFILASTIERVALPYNVCGTVLDKSSLARIGLSAFNTHFDPGFMGYPTLELANLGNRPIKLRHSMPIVQFKFEYLFSETEMPYKGKYQDQRAEPTPAKDSKDIWS